MHIRRSVVAGVALCALCVSTWAPLRAAASERTGEPAPPLAEMTLSASRADWQPTIEYQRAVLTVAGPGDLFLQRELGPGETPSLALSGGEAACCPDGMYTYELRFLPGAGRPSGQPLVLTGYLAVRDGSFVLGAPEKPAAVAPSSGSRADQGIANHEMVGDPNAVVPGELIVQGGACIGASCEEDDGHSTFRLKTGHPVLIFDDQPDGGITATHPWALVANEVFGPGEYFTLLDNETGHRPFTVEAGDTSHALYVRANGNLGLGTATPAEDVHLKRGNQPTIRLEQDASDGLGWRIWDVGANHGELFVRDATGASLPFRIQGGAPTNSLLVATNGNVGIGTYTPSERFHVFENMNKNTVLTVENLSSGASAVGAIRAKSDTAYASVVAHGSGRTLSRFGQPLASWTEILQVDGNGLILGTLSNKPLILGTNNSNRLYIGGNGNLGIGTASPAHPLQLASGAHVTAGGAWTNASSRELKHDIRPLDAQEARSTLVGLAPVRFRYNADPAEEALGFIAEEVPDLVATVDHKTLSPMDLVAVLTRVVQEQQTAIGELQARVTALAEQLAAMKEP
jgi:hypothetical protein